MCFAALKDYLANSTFHGLRFIAEDGRHWTERVFWLVCCFLSWIGSALLIAASWQGFLHNAISFVVETTYLDIETSFPTISVCEIANVDRIEEKAIEIFGNDHDYNLDVVLKEIAFFEGSAYFSSKCLSDGELKSACPSEGLKKLAEKVRSPCKEMFKTCKWKEKTFDCCSHFLPLQSEYGLCYSLSSRYETSVSTRPNKRDHLELISSTSSGLGKLSIELQIPTKIYIHAETDIPYYNTMTTDFFEVNNGESKHLGISVTDIENEPEVRQLSVSQRNCRFPEENYLTVSQVYSYSACVVQCRMMEQLNICNCSSHFMPFTDGSQHCEIEGMICLSKYSDLLLKVKTPWSSKGGLDCTCLPGCEEPEYNIVEARADYDTNNLNENLSVTEIFAFRHPSYKYKRNVVRGYLDLVVSMGGTAGLFVGASLLSFAELLYFFTIRLYNNEMRKKESN